MTLSEELEWRGFVNQTTLSDIKQLDEAPISFYWGVDPSADSMTIGHLAVAMMVRHFINHGHNAYLLVGGATGMIGDPDGKKSERELLSEEKIAHNKDAITQQYQMIFAGKQFKIVDNYEWFKGLNYLEFLRRIGKFVPLSSMLGRDFIKARLGKDGSGISYAEFSYSLIQGYDFLHLLRNHGVTLQLCGADQWGNSITGVDLIRRLDSDEAHVLSMPLVINRATGVKFGKTEAGAIWLDSKKTSIYKFYQFWLNVDDEDVVSYLKLFTLLPPTDIHNLEERAQQNPSARPAQKELAYQVTKLVHGAERADSIVRVTNVLFSGGDFARLSDNDLDELAHEIPNVSVGTTVVDALATAGVAASKGEARRLITSGAINMNGQKIDMDMPLNKITLLKKGKNNFILVR
jgi:tyrosyl-tRNA synthetase